MSVRKIHAALQSIAILLFGAVLLLSAHYMLSLARQARESNVRDEVLETAAVVRARIESELNATVFLAQGFATYVTALGPLPDSDVDQALRALYESGRHLRNVGVAPQNVIRHVYPLAGNEKALGMRYESNPQQWPAVQRAIESRSTVMVGPIDLVQGGRALLSRTPIFLADQSYWGILSVAIDIDALLDVAGIQRAPHDLDFALRGVDGQGAQGALISGDPGVFQHDPVLMELKVPGGSWQLAAMPADGWNQRPAGDWIWDLLAYGIAGILILSLWAAVRERRLATQARDALEALNQQLSAANYELGRLSETDPLTGVPNRRGLDEVLALEWRRCRRHGEALTLMMIDIDQFKAYNDAYGHIQGDSCLRQVADALQATAQRAGEFVARVGGEEFVMVLPGMNHDGAVAQAERMRADIEALAIPNSGSTVSAVVTISLGVATRVPESTLTLEALMEAADSALYRAKRLGRNRVEIASL
ncbi:sensor domain-containing diguanylate cyclase [Sinimarinibacterium sp. CAU 1509]|uniref:diguanylate cyclase n=1 Tax=Sinimarinibacterium sp. CAU 1509 TaxID=2562283 RepID=UPI0010ABA643|nr:diguanylate cyclase [Sinimarinibacterium sp. CAU 1509]TJY59409.1 sensor domain-containing diguanylate cyclase [Sinimarinibacterium sp. CAU 1509]